MDFKNVKYTIKKWNRLLVLILIIPAFIFLLNSQAYSGDTKLGDLATDQHQIFGDLSVSRVLTVSNINNRIIVIDGEKYARNDAGIQAAVNALGGSGEVMLTEAKYTLNNPININSDNVTIRGSGGATLLSASAAANAFVVTGNAVLIKDLSITGTTGDAIVLNNTNSCTIRGVGIDSCGGNGISLIAASYSIISHCGISRNSGYGISLDSDSNNNVINTNIMAGNIDGSIYDQGSGNVIFVYALTGGIRFGNGTKVSADFDDTGDIFVTNDEEIGGDLSLAGNLTLGYNIFFAEEGGNTPGYDLYVAGGNLYYDGNLVATAGVIEWDDEGNYLIPTDSGKDVQIDGNTTLAGFLTVSSDLSAAGTLFVDRSEGNVGIGTASPDATLDVDGNVSITGNLSVGDTLAVYGNGNVGIGTSSPDAELHISDSSDNATLIIQSLSTGIGTTSALLNINTGTNRAITLQKFVSTATSTWDGITLADWARLRSDSLVQGIIVSTGAAVPLIFGVDDIERMRISSAGNIGMGTKTPSADLGIIGDISVSGSLTVGDPAKITSNFIESGDMYVSDDAEIADDVSLGGDLTISRIASASDSVYYMVVNDEGTVGKSQTSYGGVKAGEWDDMGDYLIPSDPGENVSISGLLTVHGGIQLPRNAMIDLAYVDKGTTYIQSGATGNNLEIASEANTHLILDTDGAGVNTFNIYKTNTSGYPVLSVHDTGDMTISGYVSVGGNLSVGDTLFVDEANGNVGIGMATPGARLVVDGSVSIGVDSHIYGPLVTIWDSYAGALLYLEQDNTSNPALLVYGPIATDNTISVADLYANNGDIAGIHLKQSGNVGIGTIVPSTKLDILGDVSISGSLTVGDPAKVTSNFIESGDMYVSDDAEIADDVSLGGDLTISQIASPSTVVYFAVVDADGMVGKSQLRYNEFSSGEWIDEGNYLIPKDTNEDVQIDGDLTVAGDTTISSNLSVGSLFVDGSTGNTGFGTRSPNTQLHLYQDLDAIAPHISVQNPNAGSSATSALTLTEDFVNQFVQLSYRNSGGDNSFLNTIASSGTLRAGSNATGGFSIITQAAAPIRFATGGVDLADERMRIDSGGNVGIGTTSPDTKFDVLGDVSVSGYMSIGGNLSVGDTMFVDDATGNVGIGTKSPEATLNVRRGSGTDVALFETNELAVMKLRADRDDDGNADAYIVIGNGIDNPSPPDAEQSWSIGFDESDAYKFKIGYKNPGWASPGDSDLMTIDISGNVGIGTTGPVTLLGVAGDASISGSLTVGDPAKVTSNFIEYGDMYVSDDAEIADDVSLGGDLTISQIASPSGSVYYMVVKDDGTVGKSQTAYGGGAAGEWDDKGNYLKPKEASEGIEVDGNVTLSGYVSIEGNLSVGDTLFVDDMTGNVGIGTASPDNYLHIAGEGTSKETEFIVQHAANDAWYNPEFVIRRSRGTLASPLVLNDDDEAYVLAVQGYDSNSYEPMAAIAMYVDEVPGNNDMPGRIEFKTQPDGSFGWAPPTRMIIKNTGNVGIGTKGPVTLLGVAGDASVSGSLTVGDPAKVTSNFRESGDMYVSDDAEIADDVSLGGDLTISKIASPSTAVYFAVVDADGMVGKSQLQYNEFSSGEWIDEGNYLIPKDTNEDVQIDGDLTVAGDTTISSNLSVGSLFVDGSTGNTGFGTRSPTTQLHLYQNFDTIAPHISVQNPNAGTSATSALTLTEDFINQFIQLSYRNSGGDNLFLNTIASSGTLRAGSNAAGGFSIITQAAAPIRFATGGVALADERMRIDSGGNVGIGTTSPDTKFDVLGDASVSGYVSVGGNLSVGDTLYVDDATGNVGIGTAAPIADLQVNNNANGGSIIVSAQNISGYNGIIRLVEDEDKYQGGYLTYDNTGNLLKLGVHPADDADATNDTDVIILERNTGNVGIGTTGPVTLLSVAGDASISGSLTVGDPAKATSNFIESGDMYVSDDAEIADDVSLGGDLTISQIASPSDSVYYMVVNDDGTVGKSQASYGGIEAGEWDDKGNYLKPKDASEGIEVDGNVTLSGYVSIEGNLSVGDTLLVDEATGHVGIGTASPSKELDVVSNDTTIIRITSYSNTSNVDPILSMRRAKGTFSNPVTVANGDELGEINYLAYDGNADEFVGGIRVLVDGAVAVGDVPSSIDFRTEEAGAGGTDVRMIIKNDGKVGIGTEAPDRLLGVAGDASVSGYVSIGGNLSAAGTMFVNKNVGQVEIGNIQIPSSVPKLNIWKDEVGEVVHFRSDGGGGALHFGANAGERSYIYTGSNDTLTLGADYGNHLFIDLSGNVGIGTTGPVTLLGVAGDASISGSLTVGDPAKATSNFSEYGDMYVSDDAEIAGDVSLGGDLTISQIASASDSVYYMVVNDDGTVGKSQASYGSGAAGEWDDKGNYLKPKDGSEGIEVDGNVTLSGYVSIEGNLSVGDTLFVDDMTGNVGIGTSSPDTILTIITNNNQDLHYYSYSDDYRFKPDYYGLRARGSDSSPAAVQDGDMIAGFGAFAYDGDSFEHNGRIYFVVDGTPSDGNVPSKVIFTTFEDGGTRVDRMTIKNNGKVGIGTPGPVTLLGVAGDASISGSLTVGDPADISTGFTGYGDMYISDDAEIADDVSLGGDLTISQIASASDSVYYVVVNADGTVGKSQASYGGVEAGEWDDFGNYLKPKDANEDIQIDGDLTVEGDTTFSGNLSVGGFFVDSSTKNVDVGIRRSDAAVLNSFVDGALTFISEGKGDIQLYSFTDTEGNKADVDIHWSRGTPSAPAVVQQDDRIGTYRFWAYDGTDFQSAAAIRAVIDGEPASGADPTDMPARLEFLTTKDGDGFADVRMVIDNQGDISVSGYMSVNGNLSVGNTFFVDQVSGNVGIGTASTSSKLHIADNLPGGTVEMRIVNEGAQSSSQLRFEEGNADGFEIRYDTDLGATNNWLEFIGDNAGSRTLIMSLDRDSYNVGIGTPFDSHPETRLAVNGDVSISGSLTVGDPTDISTGFTGYGDMYVSDDAEIADDVSLGGDLTISQIASPSGSVYYMVVKDDGTVGKSQTAYGGGAAGEWDDEGNYLIPKDTNEDVQIDGDLTVGGQATISGDLSVGAVYVDASIGNVGIGTKSPTTFKLQVDGTVGPHANDSYNLGSDALRWANLYIGDDTVYIGTTTGDEGTIQYNTANNDFVFDSTGDVVLQSSGGNVGIGTTGPVTLLGVAGDASISGSLTVGDPADVSSAFTGYGDMYVSDDTEIADDVSLGGDLTISQIASASDSVYYVVVNADGTVGKSLAAYGGVEAGEWDDKGNYLKPKDASEGIEVDGNVTLSGYVSIEGNLSVGDTLFVNESTRRIAIGTTDTSRTITISENANVVGIRMDNIGSGGRQYDIFSTSNGSSLGGGKFSIFDATAGVPRVIVDNIGNVGIGTEAPVALLSVAGDASISGSLTVGDPADVSSNFIGTGDMYISDDVEVADDVSLGGDLTISQIASASDSVYYMVVNDDGTVGKSQAAYGGGAAGEWDDKGNYLKPKDGSEGIEVDGNVTLSGYVSIGGNLSVGDTLFVDDANGNVGIGTTELSATLGVNGNARFGITGPASTSFMTLVVGERLAADDYASIVFAPDSDSARGYSMEVHDNGGAYHFAIYDRVVNESRFYIDSNGDVGLGNGSTDARLDIKASGTGIGYTLRTQDSNEVDKFVILDNGNVGIGTTGPDRLLGVAGDVSISGYVSISDGLSIAGTLRIPFGTASNILSVGHLALETDVNTINIQAGDGTDIPATTAVAMPLVIQKDVTIMEPDKVQAVSDAIPFIALEDYNYANGIVIVAIRVATSANCNLTINVEEWTSPTSGSLSTIELMSLGGGSEVTTERTAIDDSSVAATNYIFLDLDNTNVDWVKVTIWYYVVD